MKKVFTSSLLVLSLFALPAASLHAEKKKLLTPAEMLKKLQEEEDTSYHSESDTPTWPEELPRDLPLYPGIEHLPVSLGMKGYYRWNVEAPTADRALIIETIRKGEANGWKITDDQEQSANLHLILFKRANENLVVTVSNDGVESKTVYYEYMTDAFKESISK